MKKTIAILTLATLGIVTVNAGGLHVGVNFGIPLPVPVVTAPVPVVVAPAPVVVQPPMPAPILEAAPVCPTPGYVWVGGRWGWCDNHWVWTRGYWGPQAHWGYAYHGGYHGGHYAAYHGGHAHR
jgi:WXXGXW repeat (2 copies)